MIKRVISLKSTKKLKPYFWMKAIPEVRLMLISNKTISKIIIKRSIAFPRRTPLLFSARKTMLRAILNELKTHVEVQINPPMPSSPTIFRSRMILRMFFLIYEIIPNKTVPVKPALQAALFTSLFWEVAKQLFGWYVLHLGRFSMVYGSLSFLAIFFLWIYYSSAILLLGGEVACLLDIGKQD